MKNSIKLIIITLFFVFFTAFHPMEITVNVNMEIAANNDFNPSSINLNNFGGKEGIKKLLQNSAVFQYKKELFNPFYSLLEVFVNEIGKNFVSIARKISFINKLKNIGIPEVFYLLMTGDLTPMQNEMYQKMQDGMLTLLTAAVNDGRITEEQKSDMLSYDKFHFYKKLSDIWENVSRESAKAAFDYLKSSMEAKSSQQNEENKTVTENVTPHQFEFFKKNKNHFLPLIHFIFSTDPNVIDSFLQNIVNLYIEQNLKHPPKKMIEMDCGRNIFDVTAPAMVKDYMIVINVLTPNFNFDKDGERFFVFNRICSDLGQLILPLCQEKKGDQRKELFRLICFGDGGKNKEYNQKFDNEKFSLLNYSLGKFFYEKGSKESEINPVDLYKIAFQNKEPYYISILQFANSLKGTVDPSNVRCLFIFSKIADVLIKSGGYSDENFNNPYISVFLKSEFLKSELKKLLAYKVSGYDQYYQNVGPLIETTMLEKINQYEKIIIETEARNPNFKDNMQYNNNLEKVLQAVLPDQIKLGQESFLGKFPIFSDTLLLEKKEGGNKGKIVVPEDFIYSCKKILFSALSGGGVDAKGKLYQIERVLDILAWSMAGKIFFGDQNQNKKGMETIVDLVNFFLSEQTLNFLLTDHLKGVLQKLQNLEKNKSKKPTNKNTKKSFYEIDTAAQQNFLKFNENCTSFSTLFFSGFHLDSSLLFSKNISSCDFCTQIGKNIYQRIGEINSNELKNELKNDIVMQEGLIEVIKGLPHEKIHQMTRLFESGRWYQTSLTIILSSRVLIQKVAPSLQEMNIEKIREIYADYILSKTEDSIAKVVFMVKNTVPHEFDIKK